MDRGAAPPPPPTLAVRKGKGKGERELKESKAYGGLIGTPPSLRLGRPFVCICSLLLLSRTLPPRYTLQGLLDFLPLVSLCWHEEEERRRRRRRRWAGASFRCCLFYLWMGGWEGGWVGEWDEREGGLRGWVEWEGGLGGWVEWVE